MSEITDELTTLKPAAHLWDGKQIIEVWRKDNKGKDVMIATIYPTEEGVKILTKYQMRVNQTFDGTIFDARIGKRR